jgi:predicted nuclease of predicted toxin-antitoxin system
MRLLLDQDVYKITARFLTELGHDVLGVGEIGKARASDEENLNKALELNRLFITRDRDYGNLVFVREMRIGVLYIRMLPSNRDAVHEELNRVLESYDESELTKAFVVVEAGRHRFRHI